MIFCTHVRLDFASHLGLNCYLNKEELVTSIFNHKQEHKTLTNILNVESTSCPFIKNKNTIPRLLNCLIKYPDRLAVSRLLATRSELQNNMTNEVLDI